MLKKRSKERKETSMYRYGMRSRGFSIGCQPMDGLEGIEEHDTYYVKENGKEYYDILLYNRALSESEIDEYQLDGLGEVK